MEPIKKTTLKEISLRFRDIRKYFGCSRKDMADGLKISIGAYNKNENGLNLPGFNSLYRLSEHYGISMDWLFFNKGMMDFKKNEARLKELENTVALLKGEAVKAEAEKAAVMLETPEVKELLLSMKQEPVLYHKIMLYFQEYKKEHMTSAETPSVNT
ncbi:MAG TPA: helix-turn-helix domain-containing protein [Candidatus Kapabacteria bacterium]|nr:helix-turn-helix domain-containing protein [Candidatus Kapabacteria bacterium]